MVFNDLALFVSVAETLNFSKSASQLNLPVSKLSRRIHHLESQLGYRLFERTTRQVRLTEEGKHLLRHCQRPIEELHEAIGQVRSEPFQEIRITAPPLAARQSIGPMLLPFFEDHPSLKLSLITTNANLDFIKDEIDLAFRLGPLPSSEWIAKPLWSVPYGLLASKDFCQQHEVQQPLSLVQLEELPIVFTGQPWVFAEGVFQPKQPKHHIDDLELAIEAVAAGMGVGFLPLSAVKKDLEIIPIVDRNPVSRIMNIVYPSKRLMTQRVRQLLDFILDRRDAVNAQGIRK